MYGTLWYLKRCNLFEELTPQQAKRLECRALLRSFKRRSHVYAPREPGGTVLVLARGRIKIKDVTPQGKETILAFIEEGELFGELALVDDQPRSEYAEAVEECDVLAIPCEEFLWLMEQRPALAVAVTKLVGRRRRQIESRFRNVLFLPGRQRLLHLLLQLAESHGRTEGSRCELDLPLSHQELASLVGLTRETVTLLLGQLRQEDLLRIHRRRITLLDLDRLDVEAHAPGEDARKQSQDETLELHPRRR